MFAKVFASLWQGSMVGDSDAQLVFVYLLAHSDARGVVDVTQEVVAALTGIPVERVRESVLRLESPDSRSRSPEFDGRRLLRLDEHRDWGWVVSNYAKYRDARDEEVRRQQTRDAVARHREKRRDGQGSPLEGMGTPPAALVGTGNATPEDDWPGGVPQGGAGEVGLPTASLDLGLATLTIRGEGVGVTARMAAAEKKAWAREFSEYFWPKYPRKVGKAAALKVWARIPASQQMLDAVMSGLNRWKRVHAEDDVKFMPHPSTWLSQRRWEDESQ